MCTRPILIRNKKIRSLDVEVPNSFLRVPCGSCDECLRKRAKDLFVRIKFESEYSFLHGGCGFMCTLTYDDTNMPLLHHLGQSYKVFNKRDVQLFLKRLRTYLDRFYEKFFSKKAPDFKYLVTSEFGTNPNCSHRPHYHLIILFRENVSLYSFRHCFETSLLNRKTNKRYFGKIYQCDPLDIKRGGIRYSSKYVLKDQTYSNQNSIIKEKIKFYTDYVENKHSIKQFPSSQDDELYNKAIRSTKTYRDDINRYVSPFRNMLQFYMCSNDLGCTAMFERYGDSLFRFGKLDIEGFSYSIPKAVVQKLERTKGSDVRLQISKSVFISMLNPAIYDAVSNNFISDEVGKSLLSFAEDYIQPLFGFLYLVHPSGFGFYDSACDGLRDNDALLNEVRFFDDNNLYFYRDLLISVLSFYNRQENLVFRSKLAFQKSAEEHSRYVIKKRNQGYKY